MQLLKKIGGGVIFVEINIANNFTWLKWVAILFISLTLWCSLIRERTRREGMGEKLRGIIGSLFIFILNLTCTKCKNQSYCMMAITTRFLTSNDSHNGKEKLVSWRTSDSIIVSIETLN